MVVSTIVFVLWCGSVEYTVYFVSDGDLKWKEDATASMRAEKYNAYQDELFKKYSVEKIDEVINSIDA